MGLQRRRVSGVALAVLFWFFSTPGTIVAGPIKVHEAQVDDSTYRLECHKHQLVVVESEGWRRKLQTMRRSIGPGSSPPTCKNRCGRCSPCRAVHVPIQPGVSQPLDYYPEAWRCSCGNKYFMP